jgi:hypothetical protein
VLSSSASFAAGICDGAKEGDKSAWSRSFNPSLWGEPVSHHAQGHSHPAEPGGPDNKAQAIVDELRASKMANQPTSSSRPSKKT